MPSGAMPTSPQRSGTWRPGLIGLVPLLAYDDAWIESSSPRNAPPTEITAGSLPGQPTGPPLPAAKQTTVPSATALLMAISKAVSRAPRPQLLVMMCGFVMAAREKAALSAEIGLALYTV